MADYGGVPVAASIFLCGGRTVTYKYGASDHHYWPVHANHVVMWSAIEVACARGYARFDFGRSEWDHVGLRRFKDSWGAHERPLRYTSIPGKQPSLRKSLGPRLLRPLIQRSPALAVRGLGELLYRYAA
jgi:hypothetical protein